MNLTVKTPEKKEPTVEVYVRQTHDGVTVFADDSEGSVLSILTLKKDGTIRRHYGISGPLNPGFKVDGSSRVALSE